MSHLKRNKKNNCDHKKGDFKSRETLLQKIIDK